MPRIAADKTRVVTLPLGVIEGRADFPFILALDPGGTTGWAWYDPIVGSVECGQFGPHAHHAELMTLIARVHGYASVCGRPFVLLYEEFDFRQEDSPLREATRKFLNTLRSNRTMPVGQIIGALEKIVEVWAGRDKLVLDSKEYIGICKLAVQQLDGVTLSSHNASAAKAFVKDNKLSALGWYKATVGLTHARDALRHLVRDMMTTRRVRAPLTTAWMDLHKTNGVRR